MRRTVAPLDLLLIPILFAGVLLWPGADERGGEPLAFIKSGGETRREPLTPDRALLLQGPLGATAVRFEKGEVFIESSPCPEKTCIRMGRAGPGGGGVACLPNRVSILVTGKGEGGGVDAVLK